MDAYAHVLRSIRGGSKQQQDLPVKRRKDLLQRCLIKQQNQLLPSKLEEKEKDESTVPKNETDDTTDKTTSAGTNTAAAETSALSPTTTKGTGINLQRIIDESKKSSTTAKPTEAEEIETATSPQANSNTSTKNKAKKTDQQEPILPQDELALHKNDSVPIVITTSETKDDSNHNNSKKSKKNIKKPMVQILRKSGEKDNEIPRPTTPTTTRCETNDSNTRENNTGKKNCKHSAVQILSKQCEKQDDGGPSRPAPTNPTKQPPQPPSQQPKQKPKQPAKSSSNNATSKTTVNSNNKNNPETVDQRTIRELRAQLDAKHQQLYDAQKKSDDLFKLWESEKHIVAACKHRNQLLEDKIQTVYQLEQSNTDLKQQVSDSSKHASRLENEIQQLRKQLQQKEEYLNATLQSNRQARESVTQQQSEYKDLISTFSSLSKELVQSQQEKREMEQALAAVRAMVQTKDEDMARLKLELKRSEMLRPTPRPSPAAASESEKVQALQRELQETKAKLEILTKGGRKGKKKKANHPTVIVKRELPDRPSLADFVPPQGVQILQRTASTDTNGTGVNSVAGEQATSAAAMAIMQQQQMFDDAGVQLLPPPPSLPGGQQQAEQQEYVTLCQQEMQAAPEHKRDIIFHGVDRGYDSVSSDDENHNDDDEGDGTGSQDEDDGDVTTEMDFLLASFDESEIAVEIDPPRVTRTLHLDIDRKAEVVDVHLILSIPEGYPATAPLQVEASLAPEQPQQNDSGSGPSVEARKVVMDALPDLINVCRWEANGSLGSPSLFTVLQTADHWVENEWHGIQAKRLPSDSLGRACLPPPGSSHYKIARTLLSTHHLMDPDKITFIKSTAGRYNLGGYAKLGYPGFLLVEGLEDNVAFFVEAIIQEVRRLRQNSKTTKSASKFGKADTAKFAVAGKIAVEVDGELDSGRALPKKLIEIDKSKEGMEAFRGLCSQVGLDIYLE